MLTALSKDSQGLTGYLNAQGNYLAAQVKYQDVGKQNSSAITLEKVLVQSSLLFAGYSGKFCFIWHT